MTLLFIRVFFLIIIALIGGFLGAIHEAALAGTVAGVVGAMALILLESSLRRVSVRGLSSMVFGLLLGLVMAKLIADILTLLPLGEFVHSVSRVVLTIIFSYLGAVMALRGKDEFQIIVPYVRFKRQDVEDRMMLLDTSALIDGRVFDVVRTNFFSGRLVIPRFVLNELQRLADSRDAVKKQKGRRGLDRVQAIQGDSSFPLMIHEDDISSVEDVDTKLIHLARIIDADICTTDYNLARNASIQGIRVLNLNDLVSALKPAMVPGESFEVRLVKEGKEPHQAVAYTEDGTLIVVAQARSFIGQTVRVSVTSILPTPGGRIIFAQLASQNDATV